MSQDHAPTPHVMFVPLTGFRVREPELRELGMTLPGFRHRARAIAELPALGPLTLAGQTPDPWTCSYLGVQECTDSVVDKMGCGRIAEGIREMSKHSLDDFPPHWSPPPQVALQDQSLSVTDVLSVILEEREHTAPWVREIYLEKLRRKLPDVSFNDRWQPKDSVVLPYLRVLSQLSPEDWVLQDDWRSEDVVMWLRGTANDKDRELSDEMHALLEVIVESLPEVDESK